jgi:hypothetical protein
MIYLGRKADFRWLERIIRWKGDRKEKDAAGVRGIALIGWRRRYSKKRLGNQDGSVLTGPIMVACHWNILSPVGPAEQEDGGSRPRSINSCRSGILVPCQMNEAYQARGVVGTWPQSAVERKYCMQGSTDEDTNLVNALEGHWYN